jgi:hypothetical protein
MKNTNYKMITLMLSASALLALTGCGSEGIPSDSGFGETTQPGGTIPPVVDPCPGIPSAVKQPATLDQNKTKIAVSTALITSQIGYMLSDGGMYYDSASEKSAKETKEVSKLASIVGEKIKSLQKNTAFVKARVDSQGDDFPIELGDDIACDTGTYSANYSEEDVESEGSGTYMEKFTLSFNECVLEENDGNEDLIEFFNMALMTSSTLWRLGGLQVPSSQVFTYNGSLSLEFNDAYEYTNWYVPAPIEPTDHGNGFDETYEGDTHLITEALSMEYKEDGVLREAYSSTQDLTLTFNGSYEYNGTTEYESDEAFFDGNYTSRWMGTSQHNMSVTFEGSETYQSFGEVNETMSLTALCYTAEMTNNYSDNNMNHYTEDVHDAYENDGHGENTIQSSGYLVLQDQEGEEEWFLDTYSDALRVDSSYKYNWSNEKVDGYWVNYQYSNSSTLSMDGTVGSMLIGGSVMLDTQSPWLMSSEYPNSRSNLEQAPAIDNGYNFINYTPYAGKTVLTGTNSATVEFKYETIEEQPYTYGVITVEGEEPVEYDSIYEMLPQGDI